MSAPNSLSAHHPDKPSLAPQGAIPARAVLIAFLVLVAAAPFLLGTYHVTLMNYIALYAMVALGLVLLTGVAGLTSFGQAAFVGLGAYTTAVVSAGQLPEWFAWLPPSPWTGLVLGLLLTAAAALLIGAITLKLSGHYLPLGTIAWGLSLYFLFGNLEFLGGHTGMRGIPPITVGPWTLAEPEAIYPLIWALLLLAMWATANLLDSRPGRAIRALKGGVVMAEAMGVDTAHYKRTAFLLAALLAALSGWLYAHMQRFVNPTPFGLQIGIEYLFMAVVGGAGYLWGALLGAVIITLTKQWLQDILPQLLGQSGNFELIVFGLVMVVVLQQARDGIWPILRRYAPVKATPRWMPETAEALPSQAKPQRGEVLLVADQVTRRFGGLVV